MKTLIALLAVTIGLSLSTVQASESPSLERTHDLSHWHHHHHHHHWHHGYYYYGR